MQNLFRSKFSPIGMTLDIFAADGKRRIFYAFQTLVMLAISVLAVYGLKVMFNQTINENFLLFIIGTILCIITLISITLPVIIASIMLFFASLVGMIKSDVNAERTLQVLLLLLFLFY